MPHSGPTGQLSRQHFHQGRSVAAIASLYLFRMLGLFMVLPVLTLYGSDYRGATPLLLGLALGAYGCSQAILQIPFGWWSDRWGRHPVIALGLTLFALGSLVAALSDSVYGLIIGRFLQGSGAIASALMALVADATSERHRSKAMAAIGVSIGISFSIAFILGPIISRWGGLSAIFWFTVGLAAVGMAILFFLVPNVPANPAAANTGKLGLFAVLRNTELLRLDAGILILHMVLMANFVVIPRLLVSVAAIERQHHWWVYLPTLVGAFILMLPFMLIGERKGHLKAVFIGAIALLLFVELGLAVGNNVAGVLLLGLPAFFVAFNMLEATLPAQVSKMAPGSLRGTASGVYSSSQFLGAFLGGLLGGAALDVGGPTAVFAVCAFGLGVWLLIAWPMAIQIRADSRASMPEHTRDGNVTYTGTGVTHGVKSSSPENVETV